jgi:uncharacterized RDD family membrane protein YckC
MYCSRCGTWAPDTEALCGRCGAALQLQNAPAPPPFAPLRVPEPEVVVRYAGFWRRLFAAAVDMAVCWPFTRAIEIGLGRPEFDPTEWDPAAWGIQAGLFVVIWLYDALFESSRWQGTLGQQLLDIRVTDLTGRRIGFARATGRHFGQLVSVLTLGIGYLMIAFTARKQALHDVMSGCLLVRREPAPRYASPVVTLSAPAPAAPVPAAPVPATPAQPAPAPDAPEVPRPETSWSSPPVADSNPPSTPGTGPSA